MNFFATLSTALKYFAIDCDAKGGFFGFPSWYDGVGNIDEDDGMESCTVVLGDLNDIWIIAINIIGILSRIAVLMAVAFVIYGGVLFVISQGSPEKIAAAKNTLLYAVIGLLISIFATGITIYVAGIL